MAEGQRTAHATLTCLTILIAAGVYVACAWGTSFDRASASVPAASRLVPTPFRAEAYRRSAEKEIVTHNERLAERDARNAVIADPMNFRSAALLGASYLLENRPADADRAFRVAALFGWRERLTQLYWLEVSLSAGDYTHATERLDALLRVNPDFPGRMEALAALEQQAGGRQALATRLAQRPAWAGVLLADGQTLSSGALARRIDTLVRAAALGGELGCDAIGNYASLLIQRGLRGQARLLWALHCGRRAGGGLPADASFASLMVGKDLGPFGWTRLPSGDVLLSGSTESGGKQILIGDNTAPSARPVLSQPLQLALGTYQLMVESSDTSRAALALDCGSPRRPDFPPSGTRVVTIACSDPILTVWLAPESRGIAIRKVAVVPASGQ